MRHPLFISNLMLTQTTFNHQVAVIRTFEISHKSGYGAAKYTLSPEHGNIAAHTIEGSDRFWIKRNIEIFIEYIKEIQHVSSHLKILMNIKFER